MKLSYAMLIKFSCSYTNADLKTPHMFVLIQKQYLKIFAFLILWILELFAREICKFFKNEANFWQILLFLNSSHSSHVYISKSKMCFNVRSSSYYFHMKAKRLADFQIFISVPIATNYNFYSFFINEKFLKCLKPLWKHLFPTRVNVSTSCLVPINKQTF